LSSAYTPHGALRFGTRYYESTGPISHTAKKIKEDLPEYQTTGFDGSLVALYAIYDSDLTGTNESQAFCHRPIPHTGLFASRLVIRGDKIL
jgi:hypothetical protein